MALQGSLDTFSFPEVVRLLAATAKTGCLRVDAPPTGARMWLEAGALVAAALDAVGPTDVVDVVAELLRAEDGTFAFDADEPAPDAGPAGAVAVDEALAEAGRLLEEWDEIESLFPSLDAPLGLAPDLPAATVTLDAARWEVLVAVAPGGVVAEAVARLGRPPLEACRALAAVVADGLVVVHGAGPAPAPAAPRELEDEELRPAEGDGPAADDAFVPPAWLASEPTPAWDDAAAAPSPDVASHDLAAAPAHLAEALAGPAGADDELAALASWDQAASDGARFDGTAFDGTAFDGTGSTGPAFDGTAFDGPGAGAGPSEDGPVELPELTPRAARAIAAAAQAGTEEERDAALADAVGVDDEPIDRGLLLRFLSSVRQ